MLPRISSGTECPAPHDAPSQTDCQMLRSLETMLATADDMISISGVFEAEKESECKYNENSRKTFHV